MDDIDPNELALVDGGVSASGVLASVRHGAYEAYREVASWPTALYGGWQMAGKMYGDKVTMTQRFNAMGHVHSMLSESDTLPAWAPGSGR